MKRAENSTGEQTRDSNAAWRRQFVSDVFHALSQPLTALHCSLEIALLKRSEDAEHYRSAILDALAMTKALVDTTAYVREMAEAEFPGTPVAIEVTTLLGTVLDDLAPLLESSGLGLKVRHGKEAWIEADRQKLERALFLVMDQVRSQMKAGSELEVISACRDSHAVMSVIAPATLSGQVLGQNNRAIRLACRAINSMGGTLDVHQEGPMQTSCEIAFPLR